jgi:hypothetical protein
VKNQTLLILALIISMGCSSDDDKIDCALYDPGFASLYVKFIDNSGENLIENGTIDPSDISVEGDFSEASFRFNPANEFAVPDADIRQLDNTIELIIPNTSTFQYVIRLSSTVLITLDFSAEITRLPCNLSYYDPTAVVFNDIEFGLTEIRTLYNLAEIQLD